jgi:glycosyltransferase involved in cell wall biosynthesis
MKLLSISTDRKIFEKGSAVALRQIEYAKKYEEMHVIVFADKSFNEISLAPNLWVYPTRSTSKWKYVFDALKLGRFIVGKRAITHVTTQDPFETGLVGALIKNRHAVELELQIHTDIGSPYFQKFTRLNRIRTLISKYTLVRADHVRVVSERIKKYVEKYVDPSKIEVRPVPVDVEKIKNTPITTDLHVKYPQFSKIVLMASRLEPEKNIAMAIRAFKIVLEKIPQAGLVIVGSGSEESELKNLAQKLGIENAVIFEGWQNNLASYYKTCDCFLVTSWYEGYGMTLVEAAAVGTKIVSTDVGIAKEVVAEVVGYRPEDAGYGILQTIT